MRAAKRRGRREGRGRRVVVVVAVSVLLGACGSDAATTGAPRPSVSAPPTVGEDVTTSPFAVGADVPDGYRLEVAGVGSADAPPGDASPDDGGPPAPEPFTVLLGDGDADLDVVVVAAVGFDGSEEGLDRITAPVADREVLTVEDRPGRFVPAVAESAGAPEGWAELLVDRGDDVAVRVSAESATLDQLAEVLAAADLDEAPRRAPAVPEPPTGLAVLGSAHLEWLLAEDVRVSATDDPGTGPVGAHLARWSADGAELVVLTLPPDAVDPEVLRVAVERPRPRREGRAREVAGRPAVVVDDETETGTRTTLLVETTWGDHLVLMSTGAVPLDEEALVELAASVTRIDAESWVEFVEDATG